MKPPRPFGLFYLEELPLLVVATALSVSVTGCGDKSSGSSGSNASTAPIGSVQTLAFSMPSAQFPQGDTT